VNFLKNLPKDQLQKIILVGIVTLAAVAGTVQFYVFRQWHALFEAKAQIETLTGQVADAQHRQSAATEHEIQVQQLQQFVETQQTGMAQGDAFAWVVREISLLVEKHPVRVLSLRPGANSKQAPNKETAATYSTRLEVAGTYDQLGQFIQDLENHFPTAEIRALEIAGNSGGPGTHQANIDLAFLVRPEPTAEKTTRKAAL